jgi:uncharacterized protein (DUF362 family)
VPENIMTNNYKDKEKKAAYSTGRSESIVAVVRGKNNQNQNKVLENALAQSQFWKCLEKGRLSLGKVQSALRILIKPDLDLYDVQSSTGTDPRLVEHLIELLYLRGYNQVIVADSISSSDLWLENRDVEVLADLAGYRYKTDKGESYKVINLSNDLIDAQFEPGSLMEGSKLGRDWIEADFRISFAKNKTSQETGYSLGLNSVIGVFPLRDKEYHYYHRLDPAEICAELLGRTPVHFSIIDAIVSNHGSNGSCKPDPLKTDTIIACDNIILCDFVAAMKMGLDPYIAPVNAGVMRSAGLPEKYRILGDLDMYPGWNNVPVLLSDSVRRRNEYLPAHQMARSWFQSVNKEIFPFRNYIDERINKTLTKLLDDIDSHPMGLIGATGLNYFIAWCHHAMKAYQVMYDKERIPRRQTAIGIDLKKYTPEDYSEIIGYMGPLAQIAARTPPDHNGLRWRYLDRSVIFEYKRILPVEFRKFVSHVDISAAVRMMNDNIGGACTVVKRNRAGRTILQAERNIYLPQPNWMAVFGGDFIDACKLELVTYEKNRHQIFWRTVKSPNRSARYDDGIVTFASSRYGTEITIVARQEFSLPLFWQVFNVDYLPRVKDALVSDSYTTFFSRTIANYEAAFEGRDPGAGKKWDKTAGEPDSDRPHMPVEQLVDTVLKIFEMAQPLIRAFRENSNKTSGNLEGTDGNGTSEEYKSLKSVIDMLSETGQKFFADLFEAVRKDVDMTLSKNERDY